MVIGVFVHKFTSSRTANPSRTVRLPWILSILVCMKSTVTRSKPLEPACWPFSLQAVSCTKVQSPGSSRVDASKTNNALNSAQLCSFEKINGQGT